MVKGVLIGFWTIEEESQEDRAQTKKESTLISTPSPPFRLPKNPQKNIIQLNLFFTFRKPYSKVSYHELGAFKEWKFIVQAEWEIQVRKDEFFEWLILVFRLYKEQIQHQDEVPRLKIDYLVNLRTYFSH